MVRHRTISKYVERKCQGISINAAFDSADPLVRNDEPIWSGESCGVLAMGFKLIRRWWKRWKWRKQKRWPKSQPSLGIGFCGLQDDGANPWSMSIFNSLDGNYPPLGTGWDSGYDFLLSMCTKIHLLQANWSTSRSLYFRNQASCLQTQPRVYTIAQASQYLSFCDRLAQFRNTAWSGKSGLARCISSSRNGRGSFWSCQQEGEKGLNDKNWFCALGLTNSRVPLLFRPFCVDFCFELLDWSWPDIDEGCLPTAGWLPC